jgi:hypothetical protein
MTGLVRRDRSGGDGDICGSSSSEVVEASKDTVFLVQRAFFEVNGRV